MKYYAIATNDNDRITHTFPDKEYAENWFKCPTNKQFIANNDIVIVSEEEFNDIESSKY